MNAPTERDVKKLFALSLNQCAFPDCIIPIFGLSEEMMGEICHINARSPGGARYDPTQSDVERHAFENLILLCRNHHKKVDDNPQEYPVEWLKRIKQQHETNGSIELSRDEARLAHKLLDTYLKASLPGSNPSFVSQVATGKGITQVAGDYYAQPPKQKNVITPPPGAASPAELKEVDSWIETLVENTVGMLRQRAFGMWRNRFKNHFGLRRSEELLSEQLPYAEAWYRQQLAILRRGLKTKAPDAWRNARYGAIKAAMREMGVDQPTYYAEIATRLRMKKPFKSLTELTKVDLERVYGMVLRNARGE